MTASTITSIEKYVLLRKVNTLPKQIELLTFPPTKDENANTPGMLTSTLGLKIGTLIMEATIETLTTKPSILMGYLT